MDYLTQKKFSFLCESLDDETFGVVMFKGFEAISRPYEFDIMLVTDDPDIDMDRIMGDTVHFVIHASDDDVSYNGVLSRFDQLHETNGYYFYRAILVPRLWWLTMNRNNQVFIKKSLDDIITRLMKEMTLAPGLDFEFRLQSPFREKDYVCQYGESHFDFISRWLAHEGVYYFFEHRDKREKLILTDSKFFHTDLLLHPELSYHPPAGLETLKMEEIISVMTCRRRQLPHDIMLKDYDYERPSMDIQGRAVVDDTGRGSVYSYGEHFLTSEQGNTLAKIRAQELSCRKKEFFCESGAPDVTAGYTFTLTDHFTRAFNQRYLITEVSHQGSQTGFLISGIRKALADREHLMVYQNTFTAIPADVQFRPERHISKPVISGTLHATIDASGSGDHAELDKQGRYKVRLPFDVHSDHLGGKASCYLRMLQPHAGPSVSDQSRGPLPSGFHFPLRKGTEVLLTFINGDPDRPVISGAVPNPVIPSTVNDTNQTKNIVRDHYGNELVFDSTPGDEHIRLYSPHHKSGLMLGQSAWVETGSSHYTRKLGPSYEVGAGSKFSAYGGYAVDVHGGSRQGVTAGLEQHVLLGASHAWTFGYQWEYANGAFVKKTGADAMINAKKDIVLGAGDEFCLVAGTQKDDKEAAPIKNKSIVRATRKGITLSLGENVTEHKEGDGKATWYKPELKDVLWNESKFALMSAAAALAGAGLLAAYECDEPSGLKETMTAASSSAIILAMLCAKSLYKRQMKDETIEPVTHKRPLQKIWMHENGHIGIVSTGPEGKGDDGRIVIGVNAQKPLAEGMAFYSDYKARPPENPDERDVKTGLGDGSNIIIDKKSINIRSGKTMPGHEPDSLMRLDDENGIELLVNDGDKPSQIWISKQTGNIYLSTSDSLSGEIYVTSKRGISMESGDDKNIDLTAKGKGEVTIKSNSFKVRSAISQKNLDVKN